jgi:hypothetical protein
LGIAGIVPPQIMITSVPNCLSPRFCPDLKPSPNPINNNRDATPHAIPNIVKNDRSLFAPIDRITCAKMSKRERIDLTD